MGPNFAEAGVILGPNQWGSLGPSQDWSNGGTRCCCHGCARLERMLTSEHVGRTVQCFDMTCIHEHQVLAFDSGNSKAIP